MKLPAWVPVIILTLILYLNNAIILIRVPLHSLSLIFEFLISITIVPTFSHNLWTGSSGNLKEFKYERSDDISLTIRYDTIAYEEKLAW